VQVYAQVPDYGARDWRHRHHHHRPQVIYVPQQPAYGQYVPVPQVYNQYAPPPPPAYRPAQNLYSPPDAPWLRIIGN
jgi:hypothetical protein